jgi:hypothetical protein
MSTINNLVSVNLGASALRNNQNQMNELRNQYRGREIDSDEYRERLAELRDRQSFAVAEGISNANNNLVSNLFSYMNNNSGGGAAGVWGGGTFDDSVFFGSGSELSMLQAMNSARIGIENRVRSLVGEIGRERARGMDVSDRQEALANLTGNLDILSRNLSNSVDRALGEGRGDSQFIDIVGRIRQSLAPNSTPEADEIPDSPPQTAASEAIAAPAQSVAEQIADFAVEQTPEEMSIASQIANYAQSQYAESIDIMNDNEVHAANVAAEVASEPPEAVPEGTGEMMVDER